MTRGLSLLLAVLACVLLPVAAVSTWLQLQVVDTSAYVGAVAPLSGQPVGQDAAAQAIEQAIYDAAPFGDPGVVGEAFKGLDGPVRAFVGTDLFARAWTDGNRSAHTQLIDVLADRPDSVVDDDGQVRITLDDVADALADRIGIGELSGDALSSVDYSVDLVPAADLRRARSVYAVVDDLAYWPAVGWVVLVVLALLLPGGRRRVVGVLGVGSVLAAGVVAGVLVLGRRQLLDHVQHADSDLVGAVWDALAHSLWVAAVVIAVVGAVLALGAALATLGHHRRTA